MSGQKKKRNRNRNRKNKHNKNPQGTQSSGEAQKASNSPAAPVNKGEGNQQKIRPSKRGSGKRGGGGRGKIPANQKQIGSRPSSNNSNNSTNTSQVVVENMKQEQLAAAQAQQPRVQSATLAMPSRSYKVVFYTTLQEALSHQSDIEELAKQCDQLNIVIKEEGIFENPNISPFGQIYSGDAWTTIHKRRQDEGWYSEKQI